ncbi:MAG: insulinase family protein [Gemmatimonas sp.]
MRAPLVSLVALAASPLVLAAQPATPKAASSTPPTLSAPKPLTLPTMIERRLPNGLRLVVVEQRELPVVDAQLVINTGSVADPTGKDGLATLTANMLDEGAGSRDALALAEEIAYLAIRLSTGASLEQSTVALHSTRSTLDGAMQLMADVVLRPTFPEKEFTRLRSERLTALLQEQDRGPAMADRAFAAIVYGESHPYGRSSAGVRSSVETMSRADVQSFWKSWYRPNNATLVLVGDVTVAEAVTLATRAFGGWERAVLPRSPGGASGGEERDDGHSHRRQTEGGAVELPSGRNWRGAQHRRLLPAHGHEHGARRVLHVAAQQHAARSEGIHLRRGLELLPAA